MQDLKARTKKFALDVMRFCGTLPVGDEFQIIALLKEADELVAILTSSRKAARA